MSEETHEPEAEASEPASEPAEAPKKQTRVSNKQVVTELDEVKNLLGDVVALVTSQAAEMDELRSEVASAKKASKKKAKAAVGERPDDVFIRNIHPRVAVIKLGNKRDPYRIELRPRGQRGDVEPVPASLRQDRNYLANHGLIFEEITLDEAASIQYAGARRQTGMEAVGAQVKEQQWVARYEPEMDAQGRFTPKEVERPTGLQFPDASEFPGADSELQTAAGSAKYGDEYAEFQLWKRFQAERAGVAMAPVAPANGGPAFDLRARLDLTEDAALERLMQRPKDDPDMPPVIPEQAQRVPVVFRPHQNVQPVIGN